MAKSGNIRTVPVLVVYRYRYWRGYDCQLYGYAYGYDQGWEYPGVETRYDLSLPRYALSRI